MTAVLVLFSVFLESYSTLPFSIILLTFLSTRISKNWLILVAFILGFLLDMFLLRKLGSTSIFLIIFSFITVSYQSKFEADTSAFVIFFTFLGSFAYLLYNGESNIFLISIVTSAISFLIYKISKRFQKGEKKW